MLNFRQFLEALQARGDLLRINQAVQPAYELGALLKQAEARRKAVLFESVAGSEFPVAGGLYTSPERFGIALDATGGYTLEQHRQRVLAAIGRPLTHVLVSAADCKDTVLTGEEAAISSLPVPTFFAGDSGAFITAALGISYNTETNTINTGFYRSQLLDDNRLVINASPNSGLNRILQVDHEVRKQPTKLVLVIGSPPALMMAAAAKVPANVSELDVAGALMQRPLPTVKAECSDLPVPADAEFVIEVEVDYAEQVENTMGEYGDMYGTQTAPVARVQAITHRQDPVFHSVMAGAGKEHNALGMHILYGIEPDLRAQLEAHIPAIEAVRVCFDPPRMGNEGQIFVQCREGELPDGASVGSKLFAMNSGGYPLARIIRQIVLVDTDIDISNRREVDWACATRATAASDYIHLENLADRVRLVIDARAAVGRGAQRLSIPDEETFRLDDYLIDGE